MTPTTSPEHSPLGKSSAYADQYDPSLLFPLPRQTNRTGLGIAPGTQAIHEGLVNILDDREPPGHVAVEGGVAGGHFRLVAGGQYQLAGLVGKRHQDDATNA